MISLMLLCTLCSLTIWYIRVCIAWSKGRKRPFSLILQVIHNTRNIMLFEPPPRPEDLSVIHETSHGYQDESRKFRIRSNQNTKKNFDIFKDMNIPKVIYVGIVVDNHTKSLIL